MVLWNRRLKAPAAAGKMISELKARIKARIDKRGAWLKVSRGTQMSRVVGAMAGRETFSAADIESATGLPRKHVAGYITELKRRGEVQDTGRFVRNYDRSRPAKLFERVN